MKHSWNSGLNIYQKKNSFAVHFKPERMRDIAKFGLFFLSIWNNYPLWESGGTRIVKGVVLYKQENHYHQEWPMYTDSKENHIRAHKVQDSKKTLWIILIPIGYTKNIHLRKRGWGVQLWDLRANILHMTCATKCSKEVWEDISNRKQDRNMVHVETTSS